MNNETDKIFNEVIENIPLEYIEPHPGNRTVGGFDEKKLQDLADSIKSVGVQQPTIVRIHPDNEKRKSDEPYFQLVAGERRWRASKLAGKDTLPCIIREISDDQLLTIQTVENLQREEIHPLDEASGFKELLKHPEKYDVKEIAAMVGRSESYVRQRLSLNNLEESAKQKFIENKINLTMALKTARLPKEVQKKAMKQPDYNFEFYLNHQVFSRNFNLNDAPFHLNAELFPGCPPCAMCMKRTGSEPMLFDDLAGDSDYCLDAKCFNKKLDANLELQKQTERPLLSSEWRPKDTSLYGHDDYEEWDTDYDDPGYCKEMEEDGEEIPDKSEYEECLIADGPERGKIILAKISDLALDGSKHSDDESEKDPGPKEWEIIDKFLSLLIKVLIQKIESKEIEKELIKALLLHYAGDEFNNLCYVNETKQFVIDHLAINVEQLPGLSEKDLKKVCIELYISNNLRDEDFHTMIADMFQINLRDLRDQAIYLLTTDAEKNKDPEDE